MGGEQKSSTWCGRGRKIDVVEGYMYMMVGVGLVTGESALVEVCWYGLVL